MLPQPISIAQTVVNGVVFDPKNSDRVKAMDLNELFASVGKLFDLLEERETPYVLVGGIAMLAYVPGRNTQDIDLILREEDLALLPELTIEDRQQHFARAHFGELQVDLLFTQNELFELVRQSHAADQPFADRKVQCATPLGLLMLKLFALPSLYRQGQFDKTRIYEGDIGALVELTDASDDEILAPLTPLLLASDIDELRSILETTRQRTAEREQRFRGGE